MPRALAAVLPMKAHPRLRVRGEIVDIPVEGAWMPTGDGQNYFIVSPAVRKGTGAKLGDMLDMRFVIDNQDRVDMPAALSQALALQPAMQVDWMKLTPGRQRGLAHQVAQAKTDATRQRRIHSVLEILSGQG